MTSPINDASRTILLVSPYWREQHRWMVSSVKLAELWQRIGYRVVVVCMGARTEKKEISSTLTIHTFKDFFLPDPWNYGIARGFSGRVLEIAREVHPDIVVINKILFWSSLSIFRLRRAGYRVLLLTDALVGMTWWPRGLIAKIGAYIYARTLGLMILHRAERVIFFHPQPGPLLRRLHIDQKAQVIPTGIDAAAFSGDTRRGGRDITVTYVGRLESVKGVEDLLAAATAILPQYPHVRLQIAGWYAPGHPLVEQYQRPGIRFLGLTEDVAGLLRTTDIFVLPSYSEGLSNALMEAMASGCACIATHVGGNAFLLAHGQTGLLYPPGDCDALAQHLRTLCDDADLRRRFGIAARERIEQSFSWNVVQLQYADLFHAWIR